MEDKENKELQTELIKEEIEFIKAKKKNQIKKNEKVELYF